MSLAFIVHGRHANYAVLLEPLTKHIVENREMLGNRLRLVGVFAVDGSSVSLHVCRFDLGGLARRAGFGPF